MAAPVLVVWVGSARWSGRSWIVRRRRVRPARLGCRSLSRAAPRGAWPGSASTSAACRAADPWPWLLCSHRECPQAGPLTHADRDRRSAKPRAMTPEDFRADWSGRWSEDQRSGEYRRCPSRGTQHAAGRVRSGSARQQSTQAQGGSRHAGRSDLLVWLQNLELSEYVVGRLRREGAASRPFLGLQRWHRSIRGDRAGA